MGDNDFRAHLVNSTDDVFDLMRWLSTCDVIGFDTEAGGLDKDRDDVRLIQVGDRNDGWAIPRHGWSGVFAEIVEKFEGQFVAHNAPFDVAKLRHLGIEMPLERVHCTRLMAHSVDSTQRIGLKPLASRYISPGVASAAEELDDVINHKTGWTWATIPIDYRPYWTYGALDSVLATRMFDVLHPWMMRDAPNAYHLELAVSWVCERMERRGVLVDHEYVSRLASQMSSYVEDVERWCHDAYGVKPGNTDAVIRVLQSEGVNLIKRTPSGAKYSLDKDVLGTLSHPLAQAVLGRRQAQKITSTYLDNYLRLSDANGLIHPNINVVGGVASNPFETGGGGRGVRTGRMSMSDPNLQNVPIRTSQGKMIRNSFVARPGHTWVKTDADQIEMRVLASIAGDQRMIDAFQRPGDFFTNMGRDLYHDASFQKDDPRRQTVKNSGYAKVYGAGTSKFASMTNLESHEASAFMRQFDALYPGVNQFVTNVIQTANERGMTDGEMYVRSPLTNRKLRADTDRVYSLVNHLIQGVASEILKMKIVEADRCGLGDYMLMPVHDELNLDVPNEDVRDACATLSDVMNDDDLLSTPITWSQEIGERWGEVA